MHRLQARVFIIPSARFQHHLAYLLNSATVTKTVVCPCFTRPHSSLGYLTPAEFAAQQRQDGSPGDTRVESVD